MIATVSLAASGKPQAPAGPGRSSDSNAVTTCGTQAQQPGRTPRTAPDAQQGMRCRMRPVSRRGGDCRARRGLAPGLAVGAAGAELDPDQDADGQRYQPGREEEMRGEAEDDQGHEGDEDSHDDGGHGDRSPFI